MKILTIIGARPQIIKAAAVSRAVKNLYSSQIEEFILHTGQHYDANMSQVFFDQLGIPQPHFNLGVGSGSHGMQTARMISGIEEVLVNHSFDGIILYGDTNSTLAGAVAASKIHVPVFHIEAGLRSYNMAMPEEVNPSEFFKDCFGIITNRNSAKRIVLRVEPTQAKYFRALPLHSSQQEVVHDDYSIFTYKMRITYDLKEEIMSHGATIEVLEPKELKTLIHTELEEALKNYQ